MMVWIVLALSISGNLTAQDPVRFSHVRSEEASVRALVAEGYRRSPTFRKLVEGIESRPCVVYIVTTPSLPQGMTGALLHQAAGAPDMPVLRVLLRSNLGHEEAIATLGHELQHVTEAVGTIPPPAGLDLTAVFDRLDPMTARSTGVRKYETEAAMTVTGRIRDELRRAGAR